MIQPVPDRPARAWCAGLLADGLVQVSDDPHVLDRGGWWAVVVDFEGRCRFWRFSRVRRAPAPGAVGPWRGPGPGSWTSDLDVHAYTAAVREVRRRIREGEVYQVNVCRILSAPVGPDADPWALAARLAAGNPCPYPVVLDVPERAAPAGFGATLVGASPELSLAREGDLVRSGPIKGTAPVPELLLEKDRTENVMITDLVRNDLQRVCRAGTVEVTELLGLHRHPGLVHLQSTAQGRLRPHLGWARVLEAVMPAGSVSGAPKGAALRAIAELEAGPRGPYCGAVGYVDADRQQALLTVGIRTFWWQQGRLCFGTGAGITWDSDPQGEWEETRLKARVLVGLADGSSPSDE